MNRAGVVNIDDGYPGQVEEEFVMTAAARRYARKCRERYATGGLMSDKPKHLVEEFVGKVKEEWGAYTGNPALEVEGEAEVEEAKEEIAEEKKG
jgi:uncharacterized protein YjbJ (UPF0337 family)